MTAGGIKILVVKLSSLGDVVHAMPAVQDIRKALPGAQIDWVVERAFAPLVARCTGVHRVIPCDLRRWRKTPFSAQTRQEWRAFRKTLQAQNYDWVIDLQGLTKSALVAWLARTTTTGKRVAMATQTEGSGYEAPTRWVADVVVTLPAHIHAVDRARQLCAAALGYRVVGAHDFGLVAASRGTQLEQPMVLFVHGTSRADKQWPISSWVELGLRLHQAGCTVALVHGSAAERATSSAIAAQLPHAQVWPDLALDVLPEAMAQCVGVVGVDSGVSHIAVALDLPHVQLYNFDTAWRTGPSASLAPGSARQLSVFASPCPTVDAVWAAWHGVCAAAVRN